MSSRKILQGSAIEGLVLVIVLFLSVPAPGQEATATITGIVRDPSGAVIAGAKVTLTHSQTNSARATVTGADGHYLFTLVPIGTYALAAEAPGFRRFIQSGIVLEINQNARQDITLEVGAATQVVEVKGNVAQVDTVGSTLGSVETERRILELPLVGRDTL